MLTKKHSETQSIYHAVTILSFEFLESNLISFKAKDSAAKARSVDESGITKFICEVTKKHGEDVLEIIDKETNSLGSDWKFASKRQKCYYFDLQ